MSDREKLAAALLPFVAPHWPARWGWVEAPLALKRHLLTLADEIIDRTEAVQPGPPMGGRAR